MKCTKCGAELNGKFCTNCGTPAPVEETPVASVPTAEPVVTPNTEFPTFENMPLQSEAMPESTPLSYQSEPVSQTSGSYPAQPEAMPQSGSFDSYQSTPQTPDNGTNPFAQPAQSEMPANNGYTGGMQFTNTPNTTTAQNGKKKMSGGKIAIIVIAIVLGVLLLLGIVVGVIIWNIFNNVKSGIDDFSSEFSSALEEELKDYDYDSDFEFDYDFNDYSMIEPESDNNFVYDGTNLQDYIYETEEYDDDFGWQYVIDPEDSTKAIIVGLNMYMAEDYITSKNYTITVPETIEGYKVDQIHEIYIYNPGIDGLNLKLVVPGHIKTINDYAFDYSEECLTEVVFEEGVESLGDEVLFRCDNLTKVTVPESVKLIGDKAIGYTYNTDYDEVIVKDFVLVTKKGSTADLYASKNNIKVEYN